MKATLSRDGNMRLTVTIKHRVCVDDLVNGIGWKIVRERTSFNGNVAMIIESELRAFKSRRAILIAFKEATLSEGNAIWAWSDGFDIEVCKQLREQARVLVLRKFPQLKPQPVAAVGKLNL